MFPLTDAISEHLFMLIETYFEFLFISYNIWFQFESNEADVKGEKKRSLGILDKLHNGPVLDTARAVNQLQASEERAR